MVVAVVLVVVVVVVVLLVLATIGNTGIGPVVRDDALLLIYGWCFFRHILVVMTSTKVSLHNCSIPIAVPVRPVITRHSHFIAPQPKRRFVFCDVIPGYELEQYPEARYIFSAVRVRCQIKRTHPHHTSKTSLVPFHLSSTTGNKSRPFRFAKQRKVHRTAAKPSVGTAILAIWSFWSIELSPKELHFVSTVIESTGELYRTVYHGVDIDPTR